MNIHLTGNHQQITKCQNEPPVGSRSGKTLVIIKHGKTTTFYGFSPSELEINCKHINFKHLTPASFHLQSGIHGQKFWIPVAWTKFSKIFNVDLKNSAE